MARQFRRVQTDLGAYGGVRLTLQIPMQPAPQRDSVMTVLETFLDNARDKLLDGSVPDQRRRQPYDFTEDSQTDERTGCRFRVEVRNNTTLTLTQYVSMAMELRERVWALYQRR
jgi:hypothetical protein